MEKKFYCCRQCGNLVGMINYGGGELSCCGQTMEVLKAQSAYDAGAEKHLPVVKIEDGILYASVGAVPHPMTDEHHIDWIYLETMRGGMRKMCLDQPKASFILGEAMPIAVYAYCNLHGLWRIEL